MRSKGSPARGLSPSLALAALRLPLVFIFTDLSQTLSPLSFAMSPPCDYGSQKGNIIMGNPKSFLTIARQEAGYRPLNDRLHDYSEVEQTLNTQDRQRQASRCMDCGVPFCHWGCPLGNKPPEWNDAIYQGNWKEAYRLLTATNDFPEFTGRICPAPCEKACVLHLTGHGATTIRENECSIIERAFLEGYVQPENIERNGRSVAVVGAGPAGLAAANQLNKKGFSVTVFEKSEAPGGLLRYGIPNFKLNKAVIDRRVALMQSEGVEFRYNTAVDLSALPAGFEAYIVCTGTPVARDLPVEGRHLKGIHFALELLAQQNRLLDGVEIPKESLISAKGKKVLVIGGGDTGSDCIGTANRHGCEQVLQIEILPRPVERQEIATSWPYWPTVLKTTSSHEEGCERRWLLNTCRFLGGSQGEVVGVEVEKIDWEPAVDGGRSTMVRTGRTEVIECDLVLLAMGFLPANLPAMADNVFIAGDAATGQSLVVRAIAEGRKAAEKVAAYLQER